MWKRLIDHKLPTHEHISLISAILDRNEIGVVLSLCGDDAQAFINVIDEVFPILFHLRRIGPLTLTQSLKLPDLTPKLRRKCVSTLCRMCGQLALLPQSLQIPLCYDQSDAPLYRGGYADVWKGDHQGSKVAVKVLRVYSRDDFGRIVKVY